MESPSFVQRHPATRWLVPAVVVAALLAFGGFYLFRSGSSTDRLTWKTPRQLVAQVQAAQPAAYSGTVIAQLSLGLPNLPFVSLGGSSLAPLLNGSHTLTYYYGAPDRQRVALLGVSSETDVIRSGDQLWQWSSSTRAAVHCQLPASGSMPITVASLTPQELAQWAFHAMGKLTSSTINQGRDIAGRSVYELVLTPQQSGTRIQSVHVEIDAKSLIPLGVQVYGVASTSPALDVSFTAVSFAAQPADEFQFRAPGGTRITQAAPRGLLGTSSLSRATVVTEGSPWTSVIEYRTSPANVRAAAGLLGSGSSRVHGAWGTGRLLNSSLVTVLATDDGRLYAGPVDPPVLYRAAIAGSPPHR